MTTSKPRISWRMKMVVARMSQSASRRNRAKDGKLIFASGSGAKPGIFLRDLVSIRSSALKLITRRVRQLEYRQVHRDQDGRDHAAEDYEHRGLDQLRQRQDHRFHFGLVEIRNADQ